MNVVDKLTALMNSARKTTGLTQKLSIADLTDYLGGLLPINYVDSPSDKVQTYPTDNGIWGQTYWTATLDEGVYTFSVIIDSNTKSTLTTRCEFKTGKSYGTSFQVHDWGWSGDMHIGVIAKGESKLLSATFIVIKSGSFAFGLSGNPWNGGEVTIEKPMINKGYCALPFTKNKLGGVAKALLSALLPVRGCAA